jgi:hypothetical protein
MAGALLGGCSLYRWLRWLSLLPLLAFAASPSAASGSGGLVGLRSATLAASAGLAASALPWLHLCYRLSRRPWQLWRLRITGLTGVGLDDFGLVGPSVQQRGAALQRLWRLPWQPASCPDLSAVMNGWFLEPGSAGSHAAGRHAFPLTCCVSLTFRRKRQTPALGHRVVAQVVFDQISVVVEW